MSRPVTLGLLALVILALGVWGFSSLSGGQGTPREAGGRLTAVCTTGMVADAVSRVGGDHVQVTALMGPGVDPHLYKASQGDISRLGGADIIFYNGLMLEGKMVEILEKIGRSRPVVAVAEAIPRERLREPPEFKGHPDPHVWFDVSLWIHAVREVERALGDLDPEHAEEYRRNAAAYAAELEELHGWCREQMARIPKDRRLLVTAHDAFGYFGEAYDIEVMGLQGISTVAEYGLNDIARLVDVIVRRGVKAVFVESSVPRRSIEAVQHGCRARGHAVAIGGQLFSDAMGEAGTPEGTYLGMVRHNVNTIVKALM